MDEREGGGVKEMIKRKKLKSGYLIFVFLGRDLKLSFLVVWVWKDDWGIDYFKFYLGISWF